MSRVAERLRRLRTGHSEKSAEPGVRELGLFSPLAREVETMAESLKAARAAAAAEARLREAGEHMWTAERLAVHIRNRAGSSRIFVVSNREPYMHVRQGRETVCVVPPSGLVTALEPVLRACDGVWVASGSGDADSHDGGRVRPAARASGRATLHAAKSVAFRGRGGAILRRLCQRRTLASLPYCAYSPHLPRCGLGVLSAREPEVRRRSAWKRCRTAPSPWCLCRTTTSHCCRSW